MTRVALLLFPVLVPGFAAAQSAPVVAGNGAESHTMVRAAGMPLNDGALAPGMLTVRVVQGAFNGDLAGQAVDVLVTGGKTDRAMTGTDGRVQFAHLPIGGEVRALTLVGGERLESEAFVMPSESGVRLLLVAGNDSAATTAPASIGTGGFATVVESPPVVAPHVEPQRDPESGVRMIRVALALTTACVFALFMVQRRPRRS